MRKICVVTGTRSDFGLLYWLLKRLQDDQDLKLQLIVTAMHLDSRFGLTYRLIEEEGFIIDEKVPMAAENDSTLETTHALGQAISNFGKAFGRLRPDFLILQGDRFEMLAAASAALLARIPIAHLHGGELTYGAMDEAIRHAITKLSLLHFPAAEAYRKRIIQMGEHPDRVFCVGALGLENVKKLKLMKQSELEESLGFSFKKPSFLVTYHPVTLEPNTSQQHMTELLAALDEFPDSHILFTYPNSDPDNQPIRDMIEKYVKTHQDRTKGFITLGQMRYLSSLQFVDAVIGNSSSGLIEAPAFKKPTIDVGDRQKGRLMASSVLHAEEKSNSIARTIREALSSEFQRTLKNIDQPYGGEEPSQKIIEVLKNYPLSVSPLKKEFYDL